MALSLVAAYNSSAIIAAANRPEIRLFQVSRQGSMAPLPALLNYTTGWPGDGPEMPGTAPTWTPATPRSVPQFSGVCYLTALHLQNIQHGGDRGAVYGLIDSAVGSTDVQSWMAKEARASALKTCWTPSNATALPPSHSHAPNNGTEASELWNAMIYPLVPFGLSAVLWDQGENNAQYCTESEYSCLFTSMIDLRHWRAGDIALPAAWVQIGGYAMDIYDEGGAALNSVIRYAQGDSLPAGTDQVFNNHTAARFALPVSAMAPTFDLGSPQNATNCDLHPATATCWWIHCRNKTEVGRRLALQLAHVWTAPGGAVLAAESEWSGPTVASTEVRLDAATHTPYALVSFAHAAGLALLPAQGCFHCCNQTGPGPKGSVASKSPPLFELANRRGAWLPAVAGHVDTESGTVRVTPNCDLRPAACEVTCKSPDECWLASVRYAQVDVPQCALYNGAELPAQQFSFPVPWSRGAEQY